EVEARLSPSPPFRAESEGELGPVRTAGVSPAQAAGTAAVPVERSVTPHRTPALSPGGGEGVISWLTNTVGLDDGAARQILEYLAAAKAALGALPTLDTLVFERFFDSVGGMQLVIHSPYGSRLNRAWGLALRKRFCTRFNFELQAAATEDNIVLSLTTAHSFDLADVKNYLHPNTVRGVLIEALLDAPMFTTRWRWVAGVALA